MVSSPELVRGLPDFSAPGADRPDAIRMRFSGHCRGYSLTEILVVLTLLIVVFGALYLVFAQYSRTYLRVSDHSENIAETWQVQTLLQDDLQAADCPEKDPKRAGEAVQITPGGVTILCRNDETLATVTYAWASATGDLTRTDAQQSWVLLRGRCRAFEVQACPRRLDGGPERLGFALRVEIGTGERADQARPQVLETTVFPLFLNQRVQHTYMHEGMP